MSDALTKLGEAARRARAAISPWNFFSPTDVAGFAPGGGIPSAVEPYKQGLQKTAEATKAFREGRYGDAARWYGSGVLDTGTAALSALPEGGALTKLAMAVAPAVKAAVGSADEVADAGKGAMSKLQGIKAFHGSPHDFDRFSMDKIGTGEGAQAYGHGLYFAESEGVAKSYRDALTRSSGNAANDWATRNPDVATEARAALENFAKTNGMGPPDDNLFALMLSSTKDGQAPDAFNPELAARIKQSWEKPPGRMYEVRINADPEQFLDWDKPLSEQSEAVRRSLGWTEEAEAAYKAAQGKDTDDLLAALEGRASDYKSTNAPVPPGLPPLSATGADIAKGNSIFDRASDVAKSQALKDKGIPGIKYLDAGSRVNSGWTLKTPDETVSGKYVVSQFGGNNARKFDNAQDAQAFLKEQEAAVSRNYVVFDDKLVEIVKKYGWAPGMAIPAAMALELQQAQEQSAPQM